MTSHRRALRGRSALLLALAALAAAVPVHAGHAQAAGARLDTPAPHYLFAAGANVIGADPSLLEVLDSYTYRELDDPFPVVRPGTASGIDGISDVSASDSGRFVLEENPDAGCSGLELYTPHSTSDVYVSAGALVDGSFALSRDATKVAMVAAPAKTRTAAGCVKARGKDRLVIAPASASPAPRAPRQAPAGASVDPGWTVGTISVARDDKTVAVTVQRARSTTKVVDVLRPAATSRLSQGRIYSAGACDLEGAAYMPSGRLLAIRNCNPSADGPSTLVMLSPGGSVTTVLSLTSEAHDLSVGADSRVLISGGDDLYVVAASLRGSPVRLGLTSDCDNDEGACPTITTATW